MFTFYLVFFFVLTKSKVNISSIGVFRISTMQRETITSNKYNNIKMYKRRRRRYFDCVRPSTSTNLSNSSDVGILGFVGNPSRGDYLNQGENSQLQSENKQWTRVVRTMDTDTPCSASTRNTVKTVDSWNSPSESDNRKKPLSTETWKSLLFPESNVRSHLKSEKIFEQDIKCLLDGIELAESGQLLIESSYRSSPDFYFEKIQHFADDWMQQLLTEKKELDEEAKKKLKDKFDLVSDRLSSLSGVFDAAATYMRFSEFQKQAIQSKTKELKAMKRKLIDYEEDNLLVQLNKKDRELIESRLQTDECHEKLQKTQSELAAYKINTQLDLKDMQNKLCEIRSLLIKKSSYNALNSHSFNLDVDNEQILKDITDLIEVGAHTHLVVNKDVKVTAEDIPVTAKDASFLKVTENEMHLVTLIASFLKVTPFPVSIEFIFSYVENIDNVVDIQYVENLLKKFPTFFKEVPAVPGSSKKNWIYLDLKPVITI